MTIYITYVSNYLVIILHFIRFKEKRWYKLSLNYVVIYFIYLLCIFIYFYYTYIQVMEKYHHYAFQIMEKYPHNGFLIILQPSVYSCLVSYSYQQRFYINR